MEIKKLTAEHYDELLYVLNTTFGHKYGRPMDFERELPKMWIKDDAHMGCHIGAFEDGKLCAVVGVYPMKLYINGQEFLFATTGNVATLPECEGKGYMNALFSMAMEELKEMGADGARLGGARQRYARFGYEGCGHLYQFGMTDKNRIRFYHNYRDDVEFFEVKKEDTEALRFIMELSNQQLIHVERYSIENYRDVYLVVNSKGKTPYIAIRDGKMIGYLCASANGSWLGESKAVDTEAFMDMVCSWQKRCDTGIGFTVAPYMKELLRICAAGCDSYSINWPSRYKIINWVKVLDALMKLKASCETLPDGIFYLEIRDYGTVKLYVQDGQAGCEATDGAAPELTLDCLEASRVLFGPLPAFTVTEVPPLVRTWLPLPLTWDFLDVL